VEFPGRVTLAAFRAEHGAAIAGWVTTRDEARAWSGHRGEALPGPDAFAAWHADPEVHARVLLRDGAPGAYGEIWADAVEREIELARLIVRPADRGRGWGRRLVAALLREATPFGFAHAFVRVLPGNAPALACYRGAGFVRVDAADEQRFNRGQPAAYAWLRRLCATG